MLRDMANGTTTLLATPHSMLPYSQKVAYHQDLSFEKGGSVVCYCLSNNSAVTACTNTYRFEVFHLHKTTSLPFTHPIPTAIFLLASSLLPTAPDAMIIAESGTAPSRGSTIPPMMAAGRPKSSSSSAPSGVVEKDCRKVSHCVQPHNKATVHTWYHL